MHAYFEIIKYNFLRFLTYPTEILATVFRRLMEVIFIVAFWVVITGNNYTEIRNLLSYFLIAQSVSLLVMARRTEFGKTLQQTIKYGQLNNYLTKPTNVIAYLYCVTVGNQGLSIMLSIVMIIVGILISPSWSFSKLLGFLVMLSLSAAISFAFNLIEGVYSFYITEAGSIASSTRRVIEVFSGALAPLSYYPTEVRRILELSPFPSMVFGPTNVITAGFSWQAAGTALFWAVLLNIIVLTLWQRALKHYEAVGA